MLVGELQYHLQALVLTSERIYIALRGLCPFV